MQEQTESPERKREEALLKNVSKTSTRWRVSSIRGNIILLFAFCGICLFRGETPTPSNPAPKAEEKSASAEEKSALAEEAVKTWTAAIIHNWLESVFPFQFLCSIIKTVYPNSVGCFKDVYT